MAEIHEIAEVAHKPAWKLIDPDRPTEGYRCVHEGSAGVCGQLIYRLTHAAPVHITRVRVEKPASLPGTLAESLAKALLDNDQLRERVAVAEKNARDAGFRVARLLPLAATTNGWKAKAQELEAGLAGVYERLAVAAETWPFGKDGHLWQRHERRDFGRWIREQAPTAGDPDRGVQTFDYDDLRRHLVSAHRNGAALGLSDYEAMGEHDHEHRGPGTIRSHDVDSRDWSQDRIDEAIAGMKQMEGGGGA